MFVSNLKEIINIIISFFYKIIDLISFSIFIVLIVI